MPIFLDPSSTCDICLDNFTSARECRCLPCGHLFCGECIDKLPKLTCPLCGFDMTDPNSPATLNFARKIHIDIGTPLTPAVVPVPVWISTSRPPLNRVPRVRRASHQFVSGIPLRIRDIEIELQRKINTNGLDLQTLEEISQKINQFLQNTSETLEEYPSLDIIDRMLKQLFIAQSYIAEQQKFEQDMLRSVERRKRYLDQLMSGRANEPILPIGEPIVRPPENEHNIDWRHLTDNLDTQRL